MDELLTCPTCYENDPELLSDFGATDDDPDNDYTECETCGTLFLSD